jgi:long-chain acyl-CoA synthetase
MPLHPRDETLTRMFEHSVAEHGPRELFGTKRNGAWAYMTYAEFGALVDRVRAGLASIGVERGDRVAIVSNNRPEWAVAAYACYGLGAAFVPMYEAQPPKDWEFVARDCSAKALIVPSHAVLVKAVELLDTVPSLRSIVLLDGATNGDPRVKTYASLVGVGQAVASIHPEPDDVATLLYTSGTTGNPKGVMLSHRNIASNVGAALRVFPIRSADRSLSILPWAHAFGQTAELHTMIACGASMAICEGVDKILDNLVEVKPTILVCVPTIFNRLYTAVRQQLSGRPKAVQRLVERALGVKARERSGVRAGLHEKLLFTLVDRLVFAKVRARLGGKVVFAISGGAALSREVAEFIDAIGVVVFEGYGLTETGPVVAANAPGARRIGSVGRPFPGVRVEIDGAAAEHNPVEGGAPVEGEIVVFGPNVMKGYFHRPEETAEVFTASGGFRTGDMGYLDKNGFLVITGRIKEQYKLENGKYVVPSVLEEQLKLSPYVAGVMVYGANKPYNVALVVPNTAALRKWAEVNKVSLASTIEQVVKDDRVRALFASEIRALSSEFKGFERIEDFVLVPTEFTVENGMLTPKMSLRRRKVVEVHGAALDELYKRSHAARAP